MAKTKDLETEMTASVRHAKVLLTVLIVLLLVAMPLVFLGSAASKSYGAFISCLEALLALMLIRWLFCGLESIIVLLCQKKVETMRFPEAAFPSSNTAPARRREAQSSSPVFRDPDADVHDPIVPEGSPGDMEAARRMSANLNRR
ncbi:MAG: hypothetical protein ACI4O8_03855 [Aristaeellaceae bacterium]